MLAVFVDGGEQGEECFLGAVVFSLREEIDCVI